jgi:hypothetical protein
MKMKKLLALLVMAVLSISAASAVEYPAWWEKMGAGDQLTMGSYSTINAYADAGPGFDPKTARTQYVVTADQGNPSINAYQVINMDNTITTKATFAYGGNQVSDVYRQLLSQTGSATVYHTPDLEYDSENPASKVTEVESFTQNQQALFSGDLDCPTKTFGATFENNNAIGNDYLPGNTLHQSSAATGGSVGEAYVLGSGDNVRIIEAFAGQTTSGSLVETQSSAPGEDVTAKVTMSGASSLYAGFDNAVVGETTNINNPYYANTITVKLNNDGGDKFWWTD